MLDSNQYSLILAAALVSITVNPFMYNLLPVLEKQLRRLPGFYRMLESAVPLPEIDKERLSGHVVVIGWGRVGKRLVDVLELLSIPALVIENDAEHIAELNNCGIPTLYGDAGNSEVLHNANLESARALVSTIPDDTSAMLVVAAAREINPALPILARAASTDGIGQLTRLGASQVVQPELEGGLELITQVLLGLGYPLREVYQYASAVRRDQYDFEVTTEAEHRSLHDLNMALKGVEIVWVDLCQDSPLVGQTLLESNIRLISGASVVAVVHHNQLIPNPKSMTVFEAGDRLGLIGDASQIESALTLIESPQNPVLGHAQESVSA